MEIIFSYSVPYVAPQFKTAPWGQNCDGDPPGHLVLQQDMLGTIQED